MTPIKITYKSGDDKSWNEIITLMTRVSEECDIPVKEIEVHESDEDVACTFLLGSKIVMFTKLRRVALHELAHIWSGEGHTENWVIDYAYLCKRYLSKDEYLEALWNAEKQYKSAQNLVQFIASRDALDESGRWAWGKTK